MLVLGLFTLLVQSVCLSVCDQMLVEGSNRLAATHRVFIFCLHSLWGYFVWDGVLALPLPSQRLSPQQEL